MEGRGSKMEDRRSRSLSSLLDHHLQLYRFTRAAEDKTSEFLAHSRSLQDL
jgi:hypothetical protein